MSNTLTKVVVAGMLSFALCVQAAEFKVGYIQLDRLLQDAPQTLESNKKLEREFSPRSQELDRMTKQIKEMEALLDKESTTASEVERRGKERDIQNMKIEYQRKQRELREDINLRRNEELGSLQERILKAVQAVSEAEGYDLVLHSGGVAYFSKRADITDKVLKLLGKK